MDAETKNAQMGAERAFLTKLFQAAVAGDYCKVQTSAEEYAASHEGVTVSDVLSQFKDGNKRTT
eukprot:CAMPEP_0194390046 /NCGR_PEP_ID=MMETSP0174-20130528/107670_1 /TAXON_ID=216777 /ORGANISM="Proboscia alata, Strain PI-D3" /LENGTH=63 /DNA_ID=CAMNT_0039182959 /DNA_START=65 /DNA_END=252 /DNA_ORIENTATION=+